jgi:hypothetical protein
LLDRAAHQERALPVLKTLEDFQGIWPKKINRPQIQNLFRLAFVATHTALARRTSRSLSATPPV